MSDPNKTKFLRYFFRKFPLAIEAVAEVSRAGDAKHSGTVRSYLSVENGHQEFSEAMVRHILDEVTEGQYDSEDNVRHSARIAWAALARLEIELEHYYGKPVDYQYEGGPIGEPIKSFYEDHEEKCTDPECGVYACKNYSRTQ